MAGTFSDSWNLKNRWQERILNQRKRAQNWREHILRSEKWNPDENSGVQKVRNRINRGIPQNSERISQPSLGGGVFYRDSTRMPTSWGVVVFKTRIPTSWGVYENILVGDWPILCGREQAFQGSPRTSQHIAARRSSTAKKSFQGPLSATCSRIWPVTLKTPRTIPWCERASGKPTGSPVWLLAEATSAGWCWVW